MIDQDGNIIPGDAPDPDVPDEDAPDYLHIEKAGNGFIVASPLYPNIVFEESPDAGLTDPKLMQRLLYHIIEYFGELGTKHDESRIIVDIVRKKYSKPN